MKYSQLSKMKLKAILSLISFTVTGLLMPLSSALAAPAIPGVPADAYLVKTSRYRQNSDLLNDKFHVCVDVVNYGRASVAQTNPFGKQTTYTEINTPDCERYEDIQGLELFRGVVPNDVN